MLESRATLYRFTDFIPTGISDYRYGRVVATAAMENPWVPAIRRLMAAKGWNQRELSDRSGVRPNTLSDLLAGTDSRIETFNALAVALQVPLWALFCSEHEYALFAERMRQDDAATEAAQRDDAAAAKVIEQLRPMVLALLKGETPAAPQQPSKPVLATKRHRKAGR